MEKKDIRYPLRYTFEFGSFPEAELKNYGGCSALGLIVIQKEPGFLFIGIDGENKTDISDYEWFKIWTALANKLAESATLGNFQKAICKRTYETLKQATITPSTIQPHGVH